MDAIGTEAESQVIPKVLDPLNNPPQETDGLSLLVSCHFDNFGPRTPGPTTVAM